MRSLVTITLALAILASALAPSALATATPEPSSSTLESYLPTEFGWREITTPEISVVFIDAISSVYPAQGVTVMILQHDDDQTIANVVWEEAVLIFDGIVVEAFSPDTAFLESSSERSPAIDGVDQFIELTGTEPFWMRPAGAGLYRLSPEILLIATVSGYGNDGASSIEQLHSVVASVVGRMEIAG